MKVRLLIFFLFLKTVSFSQKEPEIAFIDTLGELFYHINESPLIKEGKDYTGIDSFYVMYEKEKLKVITIFLDGYKVDLRTFYDNGNPECHFQWKNKVRQGVSKKWYKSGRVVFDEPMENSGVMGTIIFYENGTPQFIDDRKENGQYMEYYPNGQLKVLANYYNDSAKCSGEDGFEETGWHENGQLFFKRIENCGKQSFYWYYNDSVLAGEGTEIGMSLFRVGKYTEYYKNGKMLVQGYYEDAVIQSDAGFKTGTWKYWNSKGKLIREECYEHNVLKDFEDYKVNTYPKSNIPQ